MQDIDIPDRIDSYSETEQYLDQEMYGNDEEEANMETTSYAIVKLKNHMALLLMVIQVSFFLTEFIKLLLLVGQMQDSSRVSYLDFSSIAQVWFSTRINFWESRVE